MNYAKATTVRLSPASDADERMRHDYPILQQFHSKHALGALSAPSCLCCGRQTHPITRPIAVQHMELPAIVICKQCKDAAEQPVALAHCTQEQIDALSHHQIADWLRRYSHPLLKAAADSIDYLAAQEDLLEKAQQAAERAHAELAEVKRPLDEQMARLNQRVVELNADGERLDFLDRTNARFRMGWKVSKAPAGNVSVQSVIHAAGRVIGIREAIDAARNAGVLATGGTVPGGSYLVGEKPSEQPAPRGVLVVGGETIGRQPPMEAGTQRETQQVSGGSA